MNYVFQSGRKGPNSDDETFAVEWHFSEANYHCDWWRRHAGIGKCEPIRRLSVDNYGVGSRPYINNYRAGATNGRPRTCSAVCVPVHNIYQIACALQTPLRFIGCVNRHMFHNNDFLLLQQLSRISKKVFSMKLQVNPSSIKYIY